MGNIQQTIKALLKDERADVDITQAVVRPLLERIKKDCFVNGYKATDGEAMGMLLSKYFEWNGLEILEASFRALEDANFHTEAGKVEEMLSELVKE